MEFVKAVREIIGKLRKTGKTKEEILEIIKVAEDKATIKTGDKGKEEHEKQGFRTDSIDALTYAFQKVGITVQDAVRAVARMNNRYSRQRTNNWRKLHGFPMRRKKKGRKRRGNRKGTDNYAKDTDVS